VTFPTKTRKVNVDNLTYEECVFCHEKVFSQDAQEKIEQTIYGKKRTRAA
jgi:hypothetical protein